MIIRDFNNLSSVNEQSLYLAGLINVHEIKNRRPRNPEETAKFNERVYTYKVRINENGAVKESPVCYKTFRSFHGVTAKRIQNIQKVLKNTGKAPVDKTGLYDHKYCRFTPEIQSSVVNHIRSFKGRQSHYSLKKTKKFYLPETLNVKKNV